MSLKALSGSSGAFFNFETNIPLPQTLDEIAFLKWDQFECIFLALIRLFVVYLLSHVHSLQPQGL